MQLQRARQRRQSKKVLKCKIGMVRYLYVLVDCTESMDMQDMKPTRMKCSIKLLEGFIHEFFDQNPISLLGIIALRNKRAEVVAELLGNSKKHIKSLETIGKFALTGEPSLQNGFDLALKSLKMVPSHASREILVLMGSLTTCDPGDLCTTIEEMKQENVRVSCITLSAEIYICKVMCTETLGIFSAATDDVHLNEKLLEHVDPPTVANKQTCSLIKMGFPCNNVDSEKNSLIAMCTCHIHNQNETSKLNSAGFNCPQCLCKYCEIPVECVECGLTLVSAPHLARSYHHLFPVDPFTEQNISDPYATCFSCQKFMNAEIDKTMFRCGICKQSFCLDCDIYIHDVLHVCIGCSTNAKRSKK